MTYTPDANEIAQQYERREASWRDDLQPPRPDVPPSRGPVWGTLSVWPSIREAARGDNPLLQSHCHIVIKDSGIIVAYDENNDAEIFVPDRGWYLNFTPDRKSDEG